MPTSPDVVRAAYRVLLGREPESEAIVTAHSGQSPEQVLRAFVNSSEHLRRFPRLAPALDRGYMSDRMTVEYQATPAQLDALFQHIAAQWSKLGASEPYWSVLTDDRFKMSRFDEHRSEFYATGRVFATLLDVFARRVGADVPHGVCVEFGCGVGRVTLYLAERFEHVIATDISPGNLEICRNVLARAGKRNVECRLLRQRKDVLSLPEHDVFFSLIVLQHNPPPIIQYILLNSLSRVRSRGVALFQVPGNPPDYEFRIDPYLRSPHPDMEMHALPMHAVMDILRATGLHLREALMDTWTGGYGSFTYFATREA
jgi:SAM-dependent methyltransferase